MSAVFLHRQIKYLEKLTVRKKYTSFCMLSSPRSKVLMTRELQTWSNETSLYFTNEERRVMFDSVSYLPQSPN